MTQRDKLIQFVKAKHGSQLRKYTGEPYFNHLLAVAEMADGKCDFGFEIGLCHDILEDFEYTNCKRHELYDALLSFGYPLYDNIFICDGVDDLTDVYTSENSPELNRKHRKHLEALRLHQINPNSQTVKYCDLIHNTESIVTHDLKFAEVYISEKEAILEGMNKGNPELFLRCIETLKQAYNELYLKSFDIKKFIPC